MGHIFLKIQKILAPNGLINLLYLFPKGGKIGI